MIFKILLLFHILNVINSASLNKLVPLQPSESYTHSAIVDEDDPTLYQVFWKTIEASEEIQFEVHCRSRGWVGLGLSPSGGMTGADIVLAWVNNLGQGFIRDTFATGFSRPLMDQKQDWVLLDAVQVNDYTAVKMKRKLNTCDKLEDIELKEETHYLIFAWNNNDPVTGNNDWAYHGANRRIKVDYLLSYKNETLTEESEDILNAFKVEFKLDNLTIKKQSTFYYCQIIESPRFDFDVHLIRYDIIDEKINKDILHHIVLYDCPPDLNPPNLDGHECGEVYAPIHVARCLGSPILIAWGVGGQKNFSFPKDTGLPFKKFTTQRYVLAEFHYDNPQLDENRKDSSGIRFYFTDKLRKHELGVMTLGTDGLPTDITVPPGIEGLKFSSICHSECTNKFFPPEGLTLLSGFLHTHKAGRAVRTKLVRNNKVVKHLFDNPKYDFNYQFNIEIEPIKIYRGDALVTECEYSSQDRTNVTFWGHSTLQEMCYNFVYYYPRIESYNFCLSKPNAKSLLDFYRELVRDQLIPPIILNEVYYFESLQQIMNALQNQVTFTDEIRQRFIKFYNDPVREWAFCGSSIYYQNATINLEVPFLKPTELVPIDNCPAN